jgi:choline monooxygenase
MTTNEATRGAMSPAADERGDGARSSQYPLGPSLLPADKYRDAVGYHAEVEKILLRSWVVACPSSAVGSPREFFQWAELGQSVLIVRLDDGSVAAWHNVCQHRGAPLVNERSGTCPLGAFRCPAHGFSYDLEGRLAHAPLREAFDESELAGLRTPPVAVSEWAGWVWINLDENPRPLEDELGDLKPEMDWYGFSGWEVNYSGSWEVKANWKTTVDAFNETWHVPFTHRTSVRGGLLWRNADMRLMPPHSMLSIPLRKYADVDEKTTDHQSRTLCHYLAFPNTFFNCFPRLAQCFSAWPTGPRTTVIRAWAMTPPRPEEYSPEDWKQRCDRDWEHFSGVVEEDVEVLNRAGAVYDSKGFHRNMFNEAEGRLTAFHGEVASRVEESS